LTWILIFFFSVYYFFVLWIRKGWKNLTCSRPEDNGDVSVTIIIPVRNEEKNIGHLLQDLERQEYPEENFEVIVVDDQSEDLSRQIVLDFAVTSRMNIRLLEVDAGPAPKKEAIAEGIRQADGDLILLTDGDSRLEQGWLKTISNYYKFSGKKFIAGPVFIHPERSFFSSMQAVEFASLTGSAAALFSRGYPVMCNGANLAFPKDVFFEVGGYAGNTGVASGDDEFLMKKISRKYPGEVGYLKSKEAIVLTRPADSLPEFFHQRIRWAGKWNKHGLSANMILALFVFLTHCSILAGLILTLSGHVQVFEFAVLLSVKILLEFLLLHDIFRFAGKKMKLLPFFACSILYSIYAVIFGILANTGTYTWKGRKYKK
jgi:cellulose synthase/poly-beta-1,6-N-acetylglucosamine synthase-like glycosyltransferase